VLRSFVMFHAGVLAFVGWCVFSGRWYLDPVMGVVGFHGSWLASGLVAMVGYGSIEGAERTDRQVQEVTTRTE
jgi:hypothetical protein